MLACLHKAVAAGDDEGDAPPVIGDDRGQLVFQGAELQLVIPLAGAGVIRLGGKQVALRDQLVAFDRGIVMDRPTVVAEAFGGATVDTNRKMVLPR